MPGFAVVGFDVDPARAAASGIETAASARGARRRRATSSSSRSRTAASSRRSCYGDGGVLASCREGQVVVDLSTAAPSSTVRIHGDLGERGVEFVDAGISGGAAAAEKGTLSIMAGGSQQALDDGACRSSQTFSERVYHMGPSGSGHTRKAAEQLPQRDQPRRDGRGDGRRAEGRPRPRAVPRRRQPLERRQLRDAEPLPAHRRGRLPRGRAHERPDGEGREAVPRAPAAARRDELHRARVPRQRSTSPPPSGTATRSRNRVVDAIGDVAGGVRLQDDAAAATGPGGGT